MMRISTLVWLLLAGAAAAQSDKITVEWIYGGGPSQFSSVDSAQWLSDGFALVSGKNGNLDRLDPRTEKRSPHFNAEEAAKVGCKKLGLVNAKGEALRTRFPAPSWSKDGKRGFWRIRQKLVVMEFPDHTIIYEHAVRQDEKLHRFSPDGQKIAFVHENDLWVLDLERTSARRLTTSGSATLKNGTLTWVYWEEIFGRQDLGYWWSPDSSAIAFLQSDEKDVTEVTYVDFKPAVPKVIKQRYPKAGTKNPKVRLGIAEVSGRADPVTWVNLGDNRQEYVVRAKWLPDSKRVSAQTTMSSTCGSATGRPGRASGSSPRTRRRERGGSTSTTTSIS
jgi:dipeptidyl-peptidase-4